MKVIYNDVMKLTEGRRAGLVWILSGIVLIAYGILTRMNQSLPGVEQLVSFIDSIDGVYIFSAAFLAILIEGTYIVGSFFPGSSLVIILAVLSQVGGILVFFLTILAVFIGLCTAGAINIFLAKTYRAKILKQVYNPEYLVLGRIFSTWFPAFRANYEVAQIVEGGETWGVLCSSIKVKFLVSLVMLVVTLLLPFVLDINKISNEEGSVALFVIAVISLIVGVIKINNA